MQSEIFVQPSWPCLFPAKSPRISSHLAAHYSVRLKEMPLHVLGLLFCVSPFSVAPCPPTATAPATLDSDLVHSTQWDCSFLFGLLFPVLQFRKCTQVEYRPHLMCCPSFKDHSLALSTQFLKAASSYILSSFMVNYNGRTSPILVTALCLELEVTSTCLLISELLVYQHPWHEALG